MIPVNINVSRKDGERKTPQGIQARAQPQGCAKAVFFHPDYTVGSGIGPDLLTLDSRTRTACRFDDPSARGLVRERTYRRWGIAPRPEDVCGCRRTGVRILAGRGRAPAAAGRTTDGT
jgi:hypothetical protein